MADEFTLTLSPRDYTKLLNVLSQLSKVEVDAVVKRGLREGLNVVIKQGKANLKSSGLRLNNIYSGKMGRKRNGKHLKNAFRVYIKTYSKSSPSGYAGFNTDSGWYAHMLDRGTKNRTTSKAYMLNGKVIPKGTDRGRIVGNKFWTRAVESKSKQAQEELFDSVRKSINMILNRNS